MPILSRGTQTVITESQEAAVSIFVDDRPARKFGMIPSGSGTY